MTLRLILDRIEEGRVAVLTDDTLRSYEYPAELLPEGAKENDAFFGETDADGNIISLTQRENPDAGRNKLRLRRLFGKK